MILGDDWEKKVKAWKRQFPFYKRLLYMLGGYPPMHQDLTSHQWNDWKQRFDTDEYDFAKHSGGQHESDSKPTKVK